MWFFTERKCENSEILSFLLVFIVIVLNFAFVCRTLFGGNIETQQLIFGSLLSLGILTLLFTAVPKIITGGCVQINDWWFILLVFAYPIIYIINLMMQIAFTPVRVVQIDDMVMRYPKPIATPVAIFPFMFFYTPIAVKARDKLAAYSGAIIAVALTIAGIYSYHLCVTGDFWKFAFTEAGMGLVYQFALNFLVIFTFVFIPIMLLPIRVYGFALPGYWMWRYQVTAVISLITGIIAVYYLVFNEVLRTIVSVSFGMG